MSILRKHWEIILISLFIVLWGRQCGITSAARELAEQKGQEFVDRETELLDGLSVTTAQRENLQKALAIIQAQGLETRAELEDVRDQATADRQRAEEAAQLAGADLDETLDLVEESFPETRTLIQRARGHLNTERVARREVEVTLETQRDSWQTEAFTFRDERDAALLLIPTIEKERDEWKSVAEIRLERAIHWENEYNREVRTGFLDIGIPDWVGGIVGVVGGGVAGYVIARTTGG